MLFNSPNFAFFLVFVFAVYWAVNKKLRVQNVFLLVCSYFFYACWNWMFLFLLMFSTLLDYITGLRMEEATNAGQKRFWFWLSITVNLGFLGFFKYYNFFIESFAEVLTHIGFHPNLWTLQIILPIGISFYTFHGLSYVIDIYKGKIKAERNIIDYALFVSFFPLLVAGPIERATHLLPQVKTQRVFNYSKAVDGLRQILWGLFKKIVIADNCASIANEVFGNYAAYNGSTLAIGAILFAFQIYGDFSGYSDIALGSARLLGFDLIKNFAFPYFSRDIAEFWRRWHISLSTWFRDYLYYPLGGSRGSFLLTVRNTFIIFLVSGFWHGANWTFIAWGLLNALFIIPSIMRKKNRVYLNTVAAHRILPSLKDTFLMIRTFLLTTLAWIFFRSESLHDAFWYIDRIFSSSFFQKPQGVIFLKSNTNILQLPLLLLFFFIVEWTGRLNDYGLQMSFGKSPAFLRWSNYVLITILIYYFGGGQEQFIYFQF